MSSRICRLTNSPSPVPCGLVVKNGWKSRQRSASEIPRPSSSTVRTSQPSSTCASTWIRPWSSVASIAFEDEVQDDLRQVVAHADDRRQVGRDIGRDRALLGALIVLGDPERLLDHLADPDAARPSLDAGREKSTSSRIVRSIRCNCRPARSSFSAVYGSGPAALEHLHQRAERGQGIADLVGDARGQQAERRHLLLLDHPGLRGPQRVGPLLDPRVPAPRGPWPARR